MDRNSPELHRVLEKRGISSLTDLFLEYPELHLLDAAKLLSDEDFEFAPIDIVRALQDECDGRNDMHFFARVTLFTALIAYKFPGDEKVRFYGCSHWIGLMLEERFTPNAKKARSYLRGVELPEGWAPKTIFDPVLSAAVDAGFGNENGKS